MKKVLMYLSAFLPMLFIVWIKSIIILIIDIYNGRNSWDFKENILVVIGLIFFIVIYFFFLLFLKNNEKMATIKIKVLNVSNKTGDYFLGYLSLFMISLIGFSFASIEDMVVALLTLIFLGIVYIKNDLYYINPTIYLTKNYIYKLSYKYNERCQTIIAITNKKLKDGDIIDIYLSDYKFTFVKKS